MALLEQQSSSSETPTGWQDQHKQEHTSLRALVAKVPQTAGAVGQLLYKQTAAEAALVVIPTAYNYPSLNVKRYGAKGDGSTDDTVAIKTAWRVAKQQGGGTIVFPDGGVYACNSLDAATPSVNLPQQQSNGSQLYQAYQVQFYFQSGQNINFDFQGSRLTTNLTGGGAFIMVDACTNVNFYDLNVTGAQVMSTGVVSFGSLVGGSGYVNGTYNNVPLTGGAGGGAVAGIVVSGGAVQSVVMIYPGGSYVVNDVLSASNANLGGSGSGFSITVTSITGLGPTVAVAAPVAVAVVSVSGSTAGINLRNLTTTTMYIGLYCVSDPTIVNTITGITLSGATRISTGEYGVAIHNGGDDSVIQDCYCFQTARPFFFFGCKNIQGNFIGDNNWFGFQPLIKAYAKSCRHISVRYASINQPGQSGVVPRLALQVQCDPAVVSPPPFLQSLSIEYSEENVQTGSGFDGIEFAYFAGAGGTVPTATSNSTLFDNIIIRGKTPSCLQTQVLLNTNAICRLMLDQFTYQHPAGALDVSAVNGFVLADRFTYTPQLTFGGASTGMTTSLANGEYYLAGGMCHVFVSINLTAKGTSTGNAAFSLPFGPRADSFRNPLGICLGTLNMVGLSSAIAVYVPIGQTVGQLFQQFATTINGITDTSFSNTSQIVASVSFPV